jgi:hypothetical protein
LHGAVKLLFLFRCSLVSLYLQCIFLTFNAILTPELALIVQIIKRANEVGETVESLSSRFINEFSLDMDELQCLPPTREPRVTEHIEHVIELITKVCSSIVANNTNSVGLLCIYCKQKRLDDHINSSP